MLQKPKYEPPPPKLEDKKARASFYPRSRIPNELLEKIESSLTMQRILFIP
jgi:hypothetical protein